MQKKFIERRQIKLSQKKLSKSVLKIIISTIFIILILFIIFISINLYQKYRIQKNIQTVYEKITQDNFQKSLEIATSCEDLYLNIDEDNVIGVIKIEKIKYEGLVYEGTNENVLNKGIGHFESSHIIDGNVALAGHNYLGIWAKLYTLEKGDKIQYTSILGAKTYSVCDIKQIEENDISVLENTKNNMLTLITCIKNTPSKRLCVQAIEEIEQI